MLPQKLRVKKQDFPRIMKEGLVFYSNHLLVRVFMLSLPKFPQFSVVVSSKTAKTSVERHFIKRQIGSLIEKYIKEIPPSQTIIFCKKTFSRTERDIIDKELKILLINAKLLK